MTCDLIPKERWTCKTCGHKSLPLAVGVDPNIGDDRMRMGWGCAICGNVDWERAKEDEDRTTEN